MKTIIMIALLMVGCNDNGNINSGGSATPEDLGTCTWVTEGEDVGCLSDDTGEACHPLWSNGEWTCGSIL
jgi:hypothetical protein